MKAQQLLNERVPQGDDAFAELRVYRVPSSVPGSSHHLEYSLALIVRGVCVLRYDNEAGKGDHNISAMLKRRTASPRHPP